MKAVVCVFMMWMCFIVAMIIAVVVLEGVGIAVPMPIVDEFIEKVVK